MRVAQIILQQLGGNRFVIMTGAKNLVSGENYLQFGIASTMTKNKCNIVKIELTPDDTYTVTFYNLRGANLKVITEHNDVYYDQLVKLFETQTGLFTYL